MYNSDDKKVPHRYPKRPPSEVNPNNERTGDHTGRCYKCGSNDLWDDNLSYGCNNCGMMRIGG